MSEPTTEAGRALLAWFGGPMRDENALMTRILAIEQEARRQALAEEATDTQKGGAHEHRNATAEQPATEEGEAAHD